MPTIRIRGVDLHYEEYGSPDDPHVLMAHGLMGSIALMRSFAERPDDIAARGLHVIAYDARGHGRSGYTTARSDYRWAALGEDMYALIRALGIEKTSVYGGSMGAGTALMCALEHPDAVDRLILMSPPPFGAHAKAAKQYLGGLSYLYQLFGPKLTARIIMAFPQARQAQRANPRNDLRSFFAAQHRASIVPAIRGLLFDGPGLPTQRFAEIQHQALVLTHPDDPIHPLASGDLLHERMPHARLAVAPTATYWDENPDALTHVVAAFVRGEPIARGLPEKVRHEHAAG
jgi:pimeloyl-ACP methyl ester carboxylesterase